MWNLSGRVEVIDQLSMILFANLFSSYVNRRDGNFYESDLNTEYFHVKSNNPALRRPVRSSMRPTRSTTAATTIRTTIATTTQRRKYGSRARVPVLVKKLAKRPVSKVAAPEVVSVQVVRRTDLPGYNNSDSFRKKEMEDLCKSSLIECGVFNKTRTTRKYENNCNWVTKFNPHHRGIVLSFLACPWGLAGMGCLLTSIGS